MAASGVKIDTVPPRGKVQELDPRFIKWIQDNMEWLEKLKEYADALDVRLTAIGG